LVIEFIQLISFHRVPRIYEWKIMVHSIAIANMQAAE